MCGIRETEENVPATETAMDRARDAAFKMFVKTCDQMDRLEIQWAGTTQDGLEEVALPGLPGLLSHSEARAVQDSISWAISSWIASGSLPDAHRLSTYVQSMGGGQIAFTCTVCAITQMVATWALILGGHADLVSANFNRSTLEEEPSPTSPIIPQKIKARGTANTPSSSTGAGPTSRNALSRKREERGTTSTASGSGASPGKKKKKRRSEKSRKKGNRRQKLRRSAAAT